MLSKVQMAANHSGTTRCTIIALSYRGFWTSSGRASQSGVESDAAAALQWTIEFSRRTAADVRLVLWGQSIGAGVASQAAANYLQRGLKEVPIIDALILETPFTSIRSMLLGLYPQKWLPYRYLWPFLRNWWDNEVALNYIGSKSSPPKVLIVTASKDEVVPAEHGPQIEEICRRNNFNVRLVSVPSALHHEASLRAEGRNAIAAFIRSIR